MDERDIEEEGKDREGEGWGIGNKKVFFLWNVLEFLFYDYVHTTIFLNPKARRANK
jgi:hypothetical protein